MVEVFGAYDNDLPEPSEYLVIGFSPCSIPINQRWRNNGLSADFLADYMTTFFPGERSETQLNKQDLIKSAVSFIANELLENGMKFSDYESNYAIKIGLYLYPDKLVFKLVNSMLSDRVIDFQNYIKELLTSDPNELYISKLEANASDDSNLHSGLGLLSMVNDYQAQLGWKFETVKKVKTIAVVSTMVHLEIDSL